MSTIVHLLTCKGETQALCHPGSGARVHRQVPTGAARGKRLSPVVP